MAGRWLAGREIKQGCGPNFFLYIDSFNISYGTYLSNVLPDILKRLVKAFEAIRFLHIHGFKHGDIRNDHIIVERHTGNYVWIDFDYAYEISENPFGLDIFGLGNILINAIGKLASCCFVNFLPISFSLAEGFLKR